MLTNFALLTNEQKTAWSMDMWKHARNYSFVNKFLGKGSNSMIQHITELKKSEKGARAVITLLADLEGDGVAGDRTLEGNEEAMKSYDQVIRIDQLRHANRHEGRMADQKSVVEFRNNSRDVLGYWLAERIDQLAFLTPQAMAKLKLDPTYMLNVRHAQKRSGDNPLFSGGEAVMIDGIVFHEYRNVYNTSGAASGSKWGAAGNVDGCQILFCGAQALAMADIGNPEWVEKGFDYENQQGISTGKILGFLKPKFNSIYAGNTTQDFGVISVYVAQ